MSVVDDFLKKMKMVSDDDYDDYDDYDEYDDEEDDEILNQKKKPKKSFFKSQRSKVRDDEYDDDYNDDDDDLQDDIDDLDDDYSEPVKKAASVSNYKSSYSASSKVVGMNAAPSKKAATAASAEVCMIMPKSFDDANTIADVLLSHKAVVLNLEGIDMAAAQRIIDFASGSCYTVGGNLQKISKKIFIVVPSDMNLSGDFDQLIGDMIDLNSMNGLK